jgi:hypothetical protein
VQKNVSTMTIFKTLKPLNYILRLSPTILSNHCHLGALTLHI